MEKILENYSDVGTCGTVVYKRDNVNSELYEDPECTKMLTIDVLRELFYKGMVIRTPFTVAGPNYTAAIKPITMVDDGTVLDFCYIDPADNTVKGLNCAWKGV